MAKSGKKRYLNKFTALQRFVIFQSTSQHKISFFSQILDILRKDASSLQRLRHPSILHMMEALVEDRTSMAFATKFVKNTLQGLLEDSSKDSSQPISALEMKCGLLDLAEALRFLHQDAKTAHLGLAPGNVFITPTGRWLLGGFGSSMGNLEASALVSCPFSFGSGSTGEGGILAEPSLKYCAPEMTDSSAGSKGPQCGPASDVFALGMIVYEVLSRDRKALLVGLRKEDRFGHQEKLKSLLPLRNVGGKRIFSR